MLKPVLVSVLSLLLAAPTFAAVQTPAKKKTLVTKAPKEISAAEAEKIDASLAELNALINDSSLKPKNGNQAMLEDFQENLELSSKQATLTTDDFAKKDGGLQEMSPETMVAPEAELE